MAAKKKSPLNAVLVIAAVAVVAYFGYRLFFGRKVQAASSGGYYGGSGGYGSQAGYGTGYSAGNSLGSTLGNLLNKLLGGSKSSGSSGKGSSSAGGGQPGGAAGKSQAGKTSGSSSGGGLTDIYNAIVEGLIVSGPDAGQLQGSQSDPLFGGDSLLDYQPNYFSDSSLSDYQIPSESLTDFPLMASPSDPSANDWMNIPYEDYYNVPLYDTSGGGGGGGNDGGYAIVEQDILSADADYVE